MVFLLYFGMKNSPIFLITLTFPLLVVNCSTPQVTTKNLPQIHYPSNPPETTKRPQPVPQPSLGHVISIPSEVVKKNPIPNFPHIQEYGQSYVTEKFKLPTNVNETSGLIKIDGQLWTHNDSGGAPKLYQINETNGRIIRSVTIENAKNRDWEDIAYDDNYVYIGDMGNNAGTRRDLKIYKIPRHALKTSKKVRAEIISFSYNDQKTYKYNLHKHNYDCEAMIANNGKLYLFSKNWANQQTRLYELSTTPGQQQAKYISTFNINGLVTAATYNQEIGILLLTTYNRLGSVNIWAFTNHDGRNFFKGQQKDLNLDGAQGQVEGITFIDNYKAYFSRETSRKFIFSFEAALYELDFSGEFE